MRDGLPGLDGLSAYELARAKGFPGTLDEWLASLKGKDGRDGEPGQSGRDGLDGKDGAPGADGRDGRDGKDGAPGPRGARGPAGKDASPPAAVPWMASFERELISGRTMRMDVTSSDPARRTWSVHPIWTAGRMTGASITPN